MQKLGKLILVYDDNGISIDGKVVGWFDDDTAQRFEAYGWHVVPHVDGQDSAAIAAALAAARAVTDKPSLICARTIIGFGAPKQGTRPCMAKPWALRTLPRRAGHWAGPRRRSRFRPICAPRGTSARRARKAEQEWRAPLRRLSAGVSGTGRRIGAAHGRRSAGGFDDLLRAYRRRARRRRARRWPRASPRRRL